ncbi:MAG: transcriptional regulator, partial [Coxiellaceae bacterium]|nr:transcriptional regulator [Coxiellaceae bacterium]
VLMHIKRSKPVESQVQLLPYYVEVLGLDELGMLHHICEFFSNEQISIENLHVESYTSSATNAPMFSLKVSVGIPSMTNIGELRERFILFCEDLNIDGAIEPDKR